MDIIQCVTTKTATFLRLPIRKAWIIIINQLHTNAWNVTEISKVQFCDIRRSREITKQAFIEMIENVPDNAELVVSNYTIGFVVTDVEYDELWV